MSEQILNLSKTEKKNHATLWPKIITFLINKSGSDQKDPNLYVKLSEITL